VYSGSKAGESGASVSVANALIAQYNTQHQIMRKMTIVIRDKPSLVLSSLQPESQFQEIREGGEEKSGSSSGSFSGGGGGYVMSSGGGEVVANSGQEPVNFMD
jgi:uncharacterized membrane protein YgcG